MFRKIWCDSAVESIRWIRKRQVIYKSGRECSAISLSFHPNRHTMLMKLEISWQLSQHPHTIHTLSTTVSYRNVWVDCPPTLCLISISFATILRIISSVANEEMPRRVSFSVSSERITPSIIFPFPLPSPHSLSPILSISQVLLVPSLSLLPPLPRSTSSFDRIDYEIDVCLCLSCVHLYHQPS